LSTQRNSSDLGSDAEESQTAIFLCPVTDIIQYNGLMCSGVLCVRVIHLFYIVFYLVTAVHKLNFMLVQTDYLTTATSGWSEMPRETSVTGTV